MPKVKTRSAAKKRFKKVGKAGSLIKRSRAYRRHLLTKKTQDKKRFLRSTAYVHAVDMKRLKILLP